jgi:DNA modification methylase
LLSRKPTVALARQYAVLTVEEAKRVAGDWLADHPGAQSFQFGLPEIDDRYHIWRVPLLATDQKVGEVVLDARTGVVDKVRSTGWEILDSRRADVPTPNSTAETAGRKRRVAISTLPNTLLAGDAEVTLKQLPAESVDLVFTSPPYFNARPDYAEYVDYEGYLEKIRRVIRECERVLHEGRFFVMNVAPVLLRRARRTESSRRIAVPFDMHRLFVEEGFDFIDDIIWEKPEGAGWATGRGRRFAADRNPLQYKAVPVTECVLVYRKRTSRLIDWHIRTHPDPDVVRRSKIEGDYERTNIWRIAPTSSRLHPAVFPVALAERVIRYYSFEQDVVLDPFAGIGTVGEAAASLDRRFVLAEIEAQYLEVIRERLPTWLGSAAANVVTTGCPPFEAPCQLF